MAEGLPLWRSLAGSDTGRAAGMAAAQITSNVIALAFTVIFARILGASGYGSLAVLVSAFIILMVPGSALQIAVAREVSRAFAGHGTDAGAGVRQWLKRLALGTLIVAVLAIPLRDLIAGIVNVDEVWGAAAVPVTGEKSVSPVQANSTVALAPGLGAVTKVPGSLRRPFLPRNR